MAMSVWCWCLGSCETTSKKRGKSEGKGVFPAVSSCQDTLSVWCLCLVSCEKITREKGGGAWAGFMW